MTTLAACLGMYGVSYEAMGDTWAPYNERAVSGGGMQASQKRRTAAHASKAIRTRPTNNQLLYACRLGVHAILVAVVAARLLVVVGMQPLRLPT